MSNTVVINVKPVSGFQVKEIEPVTGLDPIIYGKYSCGYSPRVEYGEGTLLVEYYDGTKSSFKVRKSRVSPTKYMSALRLQLKSDVLSIIERLQAASNGKPEWLVAAEQARK